MKRWTLSFCLAALAAVSALMGYRLSRSEIRTVVVMSHAAAAEPAYDGLRDGLAALGWREGENIRFVHPRAQHDPADLRGIARGSVNEGTALVVALTTPAALALRDAVANWGIPMLLAPSSDPVSAGLVSGTVHPGEPVTGIAVGRQEPRRLEMLLRLAPRVRRIWIPHDANDPAAAAAAARLQPAAARLGVDLVPAAIHSPAQLHRALDPLPRDIDAIFIPQDALLASNTRAVVVAAMSRGLPVSAPHGEGVTQGALFSYGFDPYAMGRQAAGLAAQILSGTPAADLPIETADLDMTINLAVADYLNISIPDDILRHARIVGRAGE